MQAHVESRRPVFRWGCCKITRLRIITPTRPQTSRVNTSNEEGERSGRRRADQRRAWHRRRRRGWEDPKEARTRQWSSWEEGDTDRETVTSCSSVFCCKSEFTPAVGLCRSLPYRFCASRYALWLRTGQVYSFSPSKAVSKLEPHLSDGLQIQDKDERGSVCPQTEKEEGEKQKKERKRGQK